MMRTLGCTVLLLLLVLSATDLGAQGTVTTPARDTVRKADGKMLANVTVLEETATEVKIDRNFDGKADVTLDQNDVKQIGYGDMPIAYRQGEAFFGVGQYDQAIEQFHKAMQDAAARQWVKDYSAYYIARSTARKAEADAGLRVEAVKAFETILKNPNNRWRDAARYELGQLYLVSGEKDKARGQFTQLESSAHQDRMRLTASMGLADLLRAEDKTQEALDRYRKVVGETKEKHPDLSSAATVGQAGALIALKKYDDAQKFLENVIKTARQAPLLARTYSLLGDSHRLQAQTEPDRNKQRQLYKAALMSYLRNIVLYYKQKNQYARSLLYAGNCWKKLGEDKFAAELHNELRTKYSSTTWADELRK